MRQAKNRLKKYAQPRDRCRGDNVQTFDKATACTKNDPHKLRQVSDDQTISRKSQIYNGRANSNPSFAALIILRTSVTLSEK